MIEALRGGVRVDSRNGYSQTALAFAARDGNLPLAQAILSLGPCVDAADAGGRTALHWAIHAVLGQRIERVQALLTHGADATARDNHGQTPCNIARAEHQPEIAALFVAAGFAQKEKPAYVPPCKPKYPLNPPTQAPVMPTEYDEFW